MTLSALPSLLATICLSLFVTLLTMAALEAGGSENASPQQITGRQIYNAVHTGDVQTVRAILSHTSINRQVLESFTVRRRTILHFAVASRNFDILDAVTNAYVSTGASLDIQIGSNPSSTPLHFAVQLEYLGAVQRLIGAGAALKKPDSSKQTAGCIACMQAPGAHASEITKLLIDAEFQKPPVGGTDDLRAYLELLAESNRGEDIQWLLDHKHANPKLKDKDGKTAWDLACQSNSDAVIGVLALMEKEKKKKEKEEEEEEERELGEEEAWEEWEKEPSGKEEKRILHRLDWEEKSGELPDKFYIPMFNSVSITPLKNRFNN
jgi:ankyrin repeat protein